MEKRKMELVEILRVINVVGAGYMHKLSQKAVITLYFGKRCKKYSFGRCSSSKKFTYGNTSLKENLSCVLNAAGLCLQ